MKQFTATLKIIGINPYVSVPEEILAKLLQEQGKDSGRIPVCGTVNEKKYTQTLMKFKGEWRLYINMKMLKDSPRRIGETLKITIAYDPEKRTVKPPALWVKTLAENKDAKAVFDQLPPGRQREINRYLANLKQEVTLEKNIGKAINFLLGNGRFVGRDKP